MKKTSQTPGVQSARAFVRPSKLMASSRDIHTRVSRITSFLHECISNTDPRELDASVQYPKLGTTLVSREVGNPRSVDNGYCPNSRTRRNNGSRLPMPCSLRRQVACLWVRVFIQILGMLVLRVSAAEPFLEKVDLFRAGDNPAYKLYHIPGVVVTAKGTVLAWCEARKNGSDWDDIQILLRRSTDDGVTWSNPRNIVEVAGPKTKNPLALRLSNVDARDFTYNNPVLIADRDGTIHMLFCLEYMRCFYQRSDDDGITWSTPVEITGAFSRFTSRFDLKVIATGPNHGIQLGNDRLIVPVWLSTGTGGNAHRPSVTATIYSDDRGGSWRAGDVAVPNTGEWVNPSEAVAIELADHRVMLNVRNESGPNRRLVTTSADGATGWSTPRFDESLLEPICMSGMIRFSTGQNGGRARILFSNPDNLSRADGNAGPGKSRDRKNLSVKLSYDEGQTWPVCKIIDPGPSTYSDLAVSHRGTILCIHGRGQKPGFAGDTLTVARFNLEWLTDGRDVFRP
jgi:sialidase-1